MIRYIHGDQISEHPVLAKAMFRDRARQFRDRLGWPVTVDDDGQERDQYDDLNPLYLIADQDGCHAGSLRFLPTTGRTMVNEHFADLLGGGTIESPVIWECTRLCLSPSAGPETAGRLLLAALDLGLRSGLSDAVGVFDHRMLRVYRRLGWTPTVIGQRDGICVGLWAFDPDLRASLAKVSKAA